MINEVSAFISRLKANELKFDTNFFIDRYLWVNALVITKINPKNYGYFDKKVEIFHHAMNSLNALRLHRPIHILSLAAEKRVNFVATLADFRVLFHYFLSDK